MPGVCGGPRVAFLAAAGIIARNGNHTARRFRAGRACARAI